MPPKVFLVAIDESENSERALQKCLELGNKGDEYILVHIIEKNETTWLDPFHEPLDKYYNWQQQQKAKVVLQKYEKICQDMELKYAYENIESTDARMAICEEVEKKKPDILVVGSRGLSPVKRMLLGSVSSYLVEHASCPVLVVR